MIAVACLTEIAQGSPNYGGTVVIAVSTDPAGLKEEPWGIVATRARYGGKRIVDMLIRGAALTNMLCDRLRKRALENSQLIRLLIALHLCKIAH